MSTDARFCTQEKNCDEIIMRHTTSLVAWDLCILGVIVVLSVNEIQFFLQGPLLKIKSSCIQGIYM